MKNKKILSLSIILTAFTAFFLLNSRPIFAQTESLKKAVEGVQESVSTLVTARDDKISNDLALRLETLKKILDLSISEARDLKAKILLDDGNKSDEIEIWKKDAAKRIDDVLASLKGEQGASGDINDLETVKNKAADFKIWREKIFIPLSEEINNYSTIQKAEKVLLVVKARKTRIQEDLKKISKRDSKSAVNLGVLLEKAGKLINEGEVNFKDARSIFYKTYVASVILTEATGGKNTAKNNGLFKNTSSSPENNFKQVSSLDYLSSSGTIPFSTSTSTPTSSLTITTTTIPSSASSSISEISTSTSTKTAAADLESPPKQTITDLVRSSFQNIREAYQVFIEMSNLVRKLF